MVVCEQAAKRYVIPFVGQDVYDYCKSAHNDLASVNQDLQGQYAALLPLMREVVAYYAYTDLHDLANVHISEMGVQQSYSSDGASSPSSDYARNDSKRNNAEYADQSMDTMLAYMESRLIHDEYLAWKQSEAWAELSSLFIYQVSQLKQEIVGATWRLLHAIRATIKLIQERDIMPVLGSNLYDELIEAIQTQATNAELSEDQQTLLAHIRRYLARKAMVEAIPMLSLSYDKGIHIATYDGPVARRLTELSDNKARYLTTTLIGQSESALSSLTRYLYDNADKFGAYTKPDLEGDINNPQIGKNITRFKGSVRI